MVGNTSDLPPVCTALHTKTKHASLLSKAPRKHCNSFFLAGGVGVGLEEGKFPLSIRLFSRATRSRDIVTDRLPVNEFLENITKCG